jgi:arylsulfatase A-like enzyme
MNRIASAVIVSAFISLTACDGVVKRPNVLLICVDDLRPQLGCYGESVMVTPNLNMLASEGVLFTRHYAQVPTCGASRRCLLTGLRPSTEIHMSNWAMFETLANRPEGEQPETFIHHFRRNGYYTVGIGKISHSPDGYTYDEEREPTGQLELPNSWDEMLTEPGPWRTGSRAILGYAGGINRIDEHKQVPPYERGEVDDGGYPDGLNTNLALKKLRQLHDQEGPFLLAVGLYKPHLPFCAPARYWDLYEEDSIPLSPNPYVPRNTDPASLHDSYEFNNYEKGMERAGLGIRLSDDYARMIRHGYFACVSYIDAQIGKILDELRRLELDGNTIVIVWGDHGWHLGDHTVWGKHTNFERSLRSAFMMKVPSKTGKGMVSEGIIETIDIYPTLCELCDIPLPTDIEGQSFVPLLDEPGLAGKEAAFGYYNNGITMRTERYRFSVYARDGQRTYELFDHENDPNETVNVAGDHPDVISKLLATWEQGNTLGY